MTYYALYKQLSEQAKLGSMEPNAIKILIEELSGMAPNELYLNNDTDIPEHLLERIRFASNEYLYENKPIQYILGYTYFFGMKLKVTPAVLIPRPETEQLTDLVLTFIKGKKDISVIDIGCGSGAISLALKKENPSLKVTAVDISPEALAIAKENADMHGLEISFYESNLFEDVEGKFDVLVSNPPYIAYGEKVEKIVLENEPHLALYAQMNGLYFYQEILKSSENYLNDCSLIAFEIPNGKDEVLREIAYRYYEKGESEIIKDYSGRSRFMIIKNYWR